jgi:hypothetical protein
MLWPGLPGLAIDYRNLLHAHTHLALLGWVGNAFFALAGALFLDFKNTSAPRRIFIVLQVALLGMLGTFPWTGYAAPSIAFSTLHLAGTAWLGAKLWRAPRAHSLARPWLRVAVVWLLSAEPARWLLVRWLR